VDEAELEELREVARRLRGHVVRQGRAAQGGYVGQGLQCADIFALLYFREMHWSKELVDDRDRDRLLLSVGHYAIILYAVLVEAGLIEEAALDTYGQDGSQYTLGAEPGHVPGIEFAGGSLGQGLGAGAGLAWGLRHQGSSARVFNYMSDGELQEGSTWEAAMYAGHAGLANLVTLVDVNRTQADGDLVVEVEPVAEKFRAFGWWAEDVDGHDLTALDGVLDRARAVTDRPQALVCHTQIGRGSPTVIETGRAHFIRLRADQWDRLTEEVTR
jgi:transketolase